MRSRWFHKPALHSPALGLEKRATWLELFYDLIFVAAFIQLGNGLSSHVTVTGFAAFFAMFVPLWISWTGFTFYVNRFTVDDFLHRTLVLFQMFAVGGMAISAPTVLEGKTVAFSTAAGISQLLVLAMYLRAIAQTDEGRSYSRYWGAVFGVGGMLWLASAWASGMVVFIMWGAAALLVLGSPLSKQSRSLAERFPIDFEHLGERYALLTLIVLGESFVKVLSSLAESGAGLSLYFQAGIVLLVTCGLWWVYFDDVAGSHVRQGRAQWIVWLYGHLPLQVGVTAVGVALKKAVYFDWHAPAPTGYRWLLAGSLALAYAAVAAIDSVTQRRQAELSDRARVNMRIFSAFVLLLLAPAGGGMSGGVFLALVLAVNVAQVAFDMMMAPLEETQHGELGAKTTGEIAKERAAAGDVSPRGLRRQISETVRKGTPSELRRDIYFYFIEGSWTRVFVALAFCFIAANVMFAALFMLEPGAIHGHPGVPRFSTAFFFSVQTFSTIGYGTLSPGSPWGDAVVTAEAAVGLISVALATGLVFAKASRPRSSVLFSRSLVLTTMDGQPTLMLRAGNARGNEVVDATVTLTVLLDEISPEGHHLRRLRDLTLARARTPMFLLSWSIMHVIDEQSPLFGMDFDNPNLPITSVVVTLMAHDGTYGQTIYARHVYAPEDIRLRHHFVDVISELEDGRLMIDYGRFHDTEPDAA
ncbi:MAG: low temperature requirement protein A [Polyangiaceae bacterium]